MTSPKQRALEAQDWSRSLLKTPSQKHSSVGARRRQTIEWHSCAVERVKIRGLLTSHPCWVSACSSFGPRDPHQTAQSTWRWARGELARLFLVKKSRKWQLFGTGWEDQLVREVCACSRFASLETNNSTKEKKKRRQEETSRNKMRKQAKKSFARRNFIWLPILMCFFHWLLFPLSTLSTVKSSFIH